MIFLMENSFCVVNGVNYEAEIVKEWSCLGCAFDFDVDACLKSKQCSLIGEDFANIIWIEKKSDV